MKSIEIKATVEQVKESEIFAERCYEARKDQYAKRGQTNRDTIIRQIKAGKVFEFAVFNYIRASFPKETVQVKLPCTKITKYPSYDADIKIRQVSNPSKIFNINIKAQELYSVKRYGLSWVFQKQDTLFEKKKNEVIILGIKDGDGGKILTINFIKELSKHLDNMKEEHLQSGKKALYYKNVPEFDITTKENLEFIFKGV